MGKEHNRADRLLDQMITIRLVEERLLELFSQGKLGGTVHTCIGQEGCAVGLMSALDTERDILFSNHRGHGHYIAYCDDVRGLIAEVMGHPEGVCQGIGGSQHIQRGNFYTNGIQGAAAPIVVGMAFAEKQLGSGAIAVVNLGDGTFGEGAVYEAMNISALWSVPVVFSVEHNHYAQTTPSELGNAGNLAERGSTFGIEIHKADGMNVMDVARAASAAVSLARTESRPQILFMDTYRFAPHSKGDDFRDPAEIAHQLERDPITLLAKSAKIEDQILPLTTRARVRIDAIVSELLGGA
ncbi:Pyruvate dehydrogenase E1 component subunit alpha [uncultured Pleomorphomonas sp.]|uniref:Pyruvate dehydrogenase E1 component subunit alpha n=1 Tax=uncultured Pleomorphomonas sp. TaxID=442121 RepID=A0A212LP57_9HYPH|nr:thiamine pyrophosphate-dependent dehydrogenase E1 component subunit alpha [uncultured Pleomorphomonas sp.]SCM79297.1 Pyruvate dehydrogenase E1 component subunit alpha [uncultured Pleomorphomonas sp.]